MTRQDEIFAVIDRWQRSGKSRAAFARDEGISISTFHYWLKRHAQRSAASSVSRTTPAFIELTATAAAIAQPVRQPSPAHAPRLRLELPDGIVVTIF